MRVLGGGRGGDRLKAQNGRDGNDIRVLGGVDTTKHTHTHGKTCFKVVLVVAFILKRATVIEVTFGQQGE